MATETSAGPDPARSARDRGARASSQAARPLPALSWLAGMQTDDDVPLRAVHEDRGVRGTGRGGDESEQCRQTLLRGTRRRKHVQASSEERPLLARGGIGAAARVDSTLRKTGRRRNGGWRGVEPAAAKVAHAVP